MLKHEEDAPEPAQDKANGDDSSLCVRNTELLAAQVAEWPRCTPSLTPASGRRNHPRQPFRFDSHDGLDHVLANRVDHHLAINALDISAPDKVKQETHQLNLAGHGLPPK